MKIWKRSKGPTKYFYEYNSLQQNKIKYLSTWRFENEVKGPTK